KWDGIVAEAKKEGMVVLYSTAAADVRTDLAEAFKSKYGINMDFVTGRGSELSARLEKEYSAGVHIVDIINSGGGSLTGNKTRGILQPIKPHLILPEVTNDKAWVIGSVPYIDKDTMIFGLLASYEKYYARNTNLVNEKDITKLHDVLDPKWKGEISLFDPTTTGAGGSFISFVAKLYGEEEMVKFMKTLATMDVGLTRDKRLQGEWLAKEKYPIGIGVSPELMAEFIDKGLPVKHITVAEGGAVNTVSGGMGMASKPPHPNAAIVFANWITSKEGHAVYVKAVKLPGARVDAPTAGIDPNTIYKSGDKFIYADEEYFNLQRKLLGISKEIFAPLMQ
ncbi:MAG: extracellular solute-binding protein, partial [Dehalococcoidia bacterium]|nr:extracellular solute-binding protein [Dehalococcoidia bacterium]